MSMSRENESGKSAGERFREKYGGSGWYKDMLIFDPKTGELDEFETAKKMPRHDTEVATAVIDRYHRKFFWVPDWGRSGAFFLWNETIWAEDVGTPHIHSLIEEFWEQMGYALETIRESVKNLAETKKDEANKAGGDGESVYAEIIKESTERWKPFRAYWDQLGHTAKRSAVEKAVQRHGDAIELESAFDRHPEPLVCTNGVLHLGVTEDAMYTSGTWTISFTSHDEADMSTMIANVEYRADAECPLFEGYIETSIPDPEVRKHLQKALGAALLGKPKDKVVLNLTGPKDSGKSILLAVLNAVLGDYAKSVPAKALISKGRHGTDPDKASPSLNAAKKAKIATASEPDAEDVWDAGLIKQLTGGDPMHSRDLYESLQEWEPRFVIVIASNDFVKLSNLKDQALVERIHPINFPMQFLRPTRDRPQESIPLEHRADLKLKDSILNSDEELSGVLNWLLDGLRLWFEEGMAEPAGVTAMRGDMEVAQSFALQWLVGGGARGNLKILSEKEARDKGSDADVPEVYRVKSTEAFHDFLAWWEEQGYAKGKHPGPRKFSEEISTRATLEGKPMKDRRGVMTYDRLAWEGWREGVRGAPKPLWM